MNTKSNRIKNVLLGTIAAVSACAYSHAPHAQAAPAGQFPKEVWGADNCLYMAMNGAWQRSGWCRTFPDARNAAVWDLFSGRDAMFRFTIDQSSGHIYMYSFPGRRTFVVANRGSVRDAVIQALQQIGALSQQRPATQPASATIGGTSGPTLTVTNGPTPDGTAFVGGYNHTNPGADPSAGCDQLCQARQTINTQTFENVQSRLNSCPSGMTCYGRQY
jgi:hypothetical protein